MLRWQFMYSTIMAVHVGEAFSSSDVKMSHCGTGRLRENAQRRHP